MIPPPVPAPLCGAMNVTINVSHQPAMFITAALEINAGSRRGAQVVG